MLSTPEFIVSAIIPLLILDVRPVSLEPLVCESAVIEPMPGPPINVSNCTARGLRAAGLNTAAAGQLNRGNITLACERIANYRGCGFPLELPDPNGRQFCDQMQRSVNLHGIVSARAEVVETCINVPFPE